jgi:predicted nucleic acid-binding Zn ribbon protein
MFRRKVHSIADVMLRTLRQDGLETHLLQKRAIDFWDQVAGPLVARYTAEKYIRNQVLMVKIKNPALRQDLSMRHTELARQINKLVGTAIITDVKVF